MSRDRSGVRTRHYLLITGEKERAIEEVEAAVRLDPLSLPMMQALAGTLVDTGRVTEGLDVIDRILAIEPTFRVAVQLRGIALILVGRADEALQTLDRIIAMTDDPHRWVAERGFACARLGRMDEARRFLAMIEERQRRRPEQSLEFDFFILHTGLGNHEEAAEWLDRAAQRRLVGVLYTLNSSSFAMARENPFLV